MNNFTVDIKKNSTNKDWIKDNLIRLLDYVDISTKTGVVTANIAANYYLVKALTLKYLDTIEGCNNSSRGIKDALELAKDASKHYKEYATAYDLKNPNIFSDISVRQEIVENFEKQIENLERKWNL